MTPRLRKHATALGADAWHSVRPARARTLWWKLVAVVTVGCSAPGTAMVCSSAATSWWSRQRMTCEAVSVRGEQAKGGDGFQQTGSWSQRHGRSGGWRTWAGKRVDGGKEDQREEGGRGGGGRGT